MKTVLITLSLLVTSSAMANSDVHICDQLDTELNKVSARMTNCEEEKCSEAKMKSLNARLARIYDKLHANGCAENPSGKTLEDNKEKI